MSGLEARRVVVRAGRSLLIDGVECSAAPGRLTALVGPNGAGKSTLLRALAGVEPPVEGAVEFAGADLLAAPRRQRARIAALVEQEASTDLPLTVRDVVGLGRLPHESPWGGSGRDDDDIVRSAMSTAGIAQLADRDISTVSGGERQRVMLAKALAQRTPLLLLDEPTNHLDVSAQLAALALLRRLAADGATVLAALHDLNLAAAYCDDVIVLAAGRVVAAGPVESTLTPELIERVYGVRAIVLTNPSTSRPLFAVSPLDGE